MIGYWSGTVAMPASIEEALSYGLPTEHAVSPCCHIYYPAKGHDGYEMCIGCGTYHSLTAPPPEDVYTSDYWTHEKGHSTLAEQVYNCETHEEGGVSKNQYVLNLIDVTERTYALDIGCAPGSLLRRLREDAGFRHVFGVEMQPEYEDALREIGRPSVLEFGVFPGCTMRHDGDRFSLIVACDVFEHSHEPWPFLLECARLLKQGGQLILMLPLVVPGSEVPERMFAPEEHVFIHSFSNVYALLDQAGFGDMQMSRWCPGHEVLVVRKGEAPEGLRAA